jgi:hypothetical protein
MYTLHILEILKQIPDASFTETFLLKKYISLFSTISIGAARNKGTGGKLIIMEGISLQTVSGDGNCLFRSLNYYVHAKKTILNHHRYPLKFQWALC